MKNPPCQSASEGLRKSSGKLYQLFSSFLRGASCPKSPRAPPLPATLFMRLTAKDVKAKILVFGNAPRAPAGTSQATNEAAYKKRVKGNIKALQQNGALLRQMDRQANCQAAIEPGRHPSFRTVLIPAHKLSAATGPDLRCYTLHVSGKCASRRTRVTPQELQDG